ARAQVQRRAGAHDGRAGHRAAGGREGARPLAGLGVRGRRVGAEGREDERRRRPLPRRAHGLTANDRREQRMGDLVLAVDCSTTASKAIAWDREGRAVADARAPLEEIRPTPSESEQVAEGWWDATAQALREVVDAVGADRVAGLCITHQRESYAPVDAENRSLRNAILWDDGRAGAQLAELGERFGHDELHRRTGRGPSLTQA